MTDRHELIASQSSDLEAHNLTIAKHRDTTVLRERSPANHHDSPSGIPFPNAFSDVHKDGVDSSSDSESESELRRKRVRHPKRSATLSKDYSKDEEKAVIKKFDRKLVLFLAFLYLLSFLDRSNIGNARLAGLEKSLSMSDKEFDYCLVAFYITYITFEWMILLYRLVQPRIYISLCVFCWGLVASLQSVVTSFHQLLVLRAFLGITEASFGPGVPFYMTFFYNRSELAYRVGLQISAAPLATSFASSLAWVIVKLSQKTSLEPWRALFLFEGFPSIITAVFAWYIIPNSPETARYLTPRERKVAQMRLREEQKYETDHMSLTVNSSSRSKSTIEKLKASPTIRTLSSSIPWLQSLIFLSINVSFASLPVFLPTIINSMSFSPLTSQILSAPPYLLSFGFVLLIGHLSDITPDSRGYYLIMCSGLSALSYFTIALISVLERANFLPPTLGIVLRYTSVYPAAMGLFSSVVLIITWNLNNQPSKKEKGLAMMVMNVVGQCGPLIGVQLFPKADGPYYVRGMVVSGLFMMGVGVLAIVLRWRLRKLNEGTEDHEAGRDFEMVSLREGRGEMADGEQETHDLVARVHDKRGFVYML